MLKNEKKIYLIISASVISFLVLGFFVVKPLFEQIQKVYHNLTIQKATLLGLEKQITAFDDFKEDIKNYEYDFQKLKSSFINKAVPLDFINFLENQAKANNIEISISTAEFVQAEEGLWQKTLFELTLTGWLNGCLRFLEQLENSPWFLEVISLDVSKSGFDFNNNQSNVRINLKVNVFSSEQYTASEL